MTICPHCGKRSYASRGQALKTALALTRAHARRRPKHGKDARELRPYRCPHGGLWHLTSQERR